MLTNDTKTNFNKQWYSDNDEDCSCSSCDCSNCINKDTSSKIQQNETISMTEQQSLYDIIDQSYTRIPVLYNSIKQTKLDTDFILSVNDYLDRLKANIYKDLIRRETVLRNGKNHIENFISLIRCICKISYEQSLEISNNLNIIEYAVIYIMTAIDYILQCNFPQKKTLLNYILNEYISMWLHENLRIIQEDFSIISKYGTKTNFFSLCICIFRKLEFLCTINWKRLQMIQNYRLSNFNQLMKETSIKLETSQDFILLFGKSLKSTMKKSEIPITLLYSNRTDNELRDIDGIHNIFTKSIAKILSADNHKLPFQSSSSQQIVSSSVEIVSPISNELINVDYYSASKENEDRSMKEKDVIDESKTILKMVDQQEQSTQPIEPILLSHYPSTTSSLTDQFKEPQRTSLSESKLVSLEDQQQLWSIETNSQQNLSSTSVHESPSEFQVTNTEHINSYHEDVQKLDSSLKTQTKENISSIDHSLQESFVPEKPLTCNPFSSTSYHSSLDNSIPISSTAILNTEINELIHFLTDLANSSTFVHQKKESSSLLKQLASCLKQNNIDTKSIINKIQHSNSQASLSVSDPLFLAKFTHVLRKELEDAQILREIDREQSQNIDCPSFETRNILKLSKSNTSTRDHIDQDRVCIEVTHDPSRCTPNPEIFCHPCVTQCHQCCCDDSSSSQSDCCQQRMYWIRSKEYSTCKDCTVTPNSLFCARESLEKNTHSVTVEHNEEFR
ncbi:unnamed protein product [Adineta steineri]|uniref:Uncharacterized protein n=1 Tax=Adineta steineri TaxID=433720 RepID=A0A819F8D1_9BILA|nr:unnamed protein product [Adineta steineri]